MIIWSGWGFLVAVIVFSASLAMEVVTEALTKDHRFYQTRAWPLALALALAGAITFGVGKYLSTRDNHHRFFFMPMHYWGPILLAIALVSLVAR